MSQFLRYRSVAVAVIINPETMEFLLCYNPRWKGYAFPMKSFKDGADPAAMAIAAVSEDGSGLGLKQATATPAGRHAVVRESMGVHQLTGYDYHIFDVEAGPELAKVNIGRDVKWFSYDEIKTLENITSSTKLIAESLIESRKTALAIITRDAPTESEFLLIWNPNRGYFFPAARMKTETLLADAVGGIIQDDLNYPGAWDIVDQSEVEVLQTSQRFGSQEVRFLFQLCKTTLTDVDLNAAGNPLASALDTLQGELTDSGLLAAGTPLAIWCSAEELKSRTDLSPSIESVRAFAVQLAERK